MTITNERLHEIESRNLPLMPRLEECSEMAKELLGRRTGWIMLDITSPSGKQLWACVCCGHATTGPTNTHECQLREQS
jgi:hypothetical protein